MDGVIFKINLVFSMHVIVRFCKTDNSTANKHTYMHILTKHFKESWFGFDQHSFFNFLSKIGLCKEDITIIDLSSWCTTVHTNQLMDLVSVFKLL